MAVDGIIGTLASKTREERSRIRHNVERWLTSDDASKQADAERVAVALDEIDAREERERRDEVAGMTAYESVLRAFDRLPPSEADITVITALLANPDASSSVLTQWCGWQGRSAWHLHFGEMCKRRRQDLWSGPISETRGAEFFSAILADYDPATSTFTMKPDVARAFRALGVPSGPIPRGAP